MSKAVSSANTRSQSLASGSPQVTDWLPERLKSGAVQAQFRHVHEQELAVLSVTEGEQRALCLSGGGIRSATFSLGVLQGLADRNLLGQFDYLSTVSGGGYIGSWLSAWIFRHPEGMQGVERELKSGNYPEATPIGHLRRFSNYLTPKLGLFSLDTLTMASILVRNLLLNWLVLLPVFFAALLLPRFVLSLYGDNWHWEFATGGALSCSLLVVGGVLAGTGLRTTGKRGVYQFTATLLCLLGAAIVFPVELQADGVWSKWGASLSAAVALLPWVAVPVVIMTAAYAYAWKRHERFSQGLRIANATVLGGSLLLLVAYVFVQQVIPWATKDDAVRVAYVTPLLLAGLIVVGYVVTGLAHTNESEQHREWLSSLSGWLGGLAVAWAALGTVVLYGPKLYESSVLAALSHWAAMGDEPAERSAKGITAIVGIATGAYTAFKGHDAKSAAGRKGARPLPISMGVAMGVFAVALALGLSVLADTIIPAVGASNIGSTHDGVLVATRPKPLFFLIVAVAASAVILSRYISLNKFSLHSMYRNRLVTAYVGASRIASGAQPKRSIPRYDPEDDLELHEFVPRGDGRPLHLINMALNLQGGENLAWQERRAESFVASPLHTGFEPPGTGPSNGGYRPTEFYGGYKDKPITLGTAMAISGAAANPNMGYHSSPLVTFIMTLFNARLGWWLGNPGRFGSAYGMYDAPWMRSGPALGMVYLLREALGLTTDTLRFVNLSDGGHFENLGLYEAVRRRCRTIVVVDGGCDEEYTLSDLGNAIRKCRIDLGADIDFGKSLLGIRNRTSRCAIATIKYSCRSGDSSEAIPPGRLVYVKPVILPDAAQPEPIDVLTYHSEHDTFPNEPTADQFFSESQFESYRRLGLHTILTSPEFRDEVSLFVDNGGLGRTLVRSSRPPVRKTG